MKHLHLAAGLSVLCLGAAVMPANAGIIALTRPIVVVCDGQAKTSTINIGGFTASSTQGVLGGSITVVQNHANLQYINVSVSAQTFLVLGETGISTQTIFPGAAEFGFPPTLSVSASIKATADSTGNIPIKTRGVCKGGNQVRALVILYFLTNP